MASNTEFYPLLSDLLPLGDLPDSLSSFETALTDALDKLFYHDLQYQVTDDRSKRFYRLKIFTYNSVGFAFPNTEFKIVLNPALIPGGAVSSSFPVNFSYEHDILRYLDLEDITDFSESFQEYFDLFLSIAGLSKSLLMQELINTLIGGADPVDSFISQFNAIYSEPATQLTILISDDIYEVIDNLIDQIDDFPDIDLLEVVFQDFVNTDPSEVLGNLETLFKRWIGDLDLDEILNLFIPRIRLEIETIDVGLQFPVNILRQVDPASLLPLKDSEDNDVPGLLIFNLGSLSLSTETGFDYKGENAFSFPTAEVLKTGLILDFTGLKLDLSDSKNIFEATADGRPETFKGIYIQEANIRLPDILQPEGGNVSIVSKNLLIGSEGGISGTIGIESMSASEMRLDFEVSTPIGTGFVFDSDLMTISGIKKIVDPDGGEDDFLDEPKSIEIGIPIGGINILDAENNYYLIADDGTVSLETPPNGLLEFKVGTNTTISITNFYLTFNKNKVVSSTVTGTLNTPKLEESLAITIDFTDGFRIHVSYPYPPGIDAIKTNIITLNLRDFELGRVDEKIFIGLKGTITNNLEIPYVNKFVPNIIDAQNLKWTQGEGIDYNLILEWANGLKLGLSNDGPPALEKSTFRIPFNQKKDDGLFKLEAIDLTIAPVEGGFGVGVQLVGAVFNLKKIVVLTIDGLGAQVDLTKVEEGGNIGPFNAAFGLIPPKGIGLKVDAKAITGGGYVFLDFEKGRYVGVAELTIKDKISLKVIGIITTKLPSGEKGNSVLLLVTAEFSPINLSFGFTLNGVGGLVGINRDMNLQALRDGVKTNAIDNIMFPDDPVGNISQIVSDLETIFPIQKGRYTFGVMGLIGWGTPTLITIELGLMLSVPKPVRLAVLGVIKCLMPTDDNDLVKLQINFVGTIDFEAKYITFDASIYDSKLLTFGLAGDMAFRLKWGDEPNFLFSVGGFHPSYTPPPLNLPTMNRLMINFLAEDNPRLTLSTYLAVTSNTVQMGSLLDFYFSLAGGLEVIGNLGFDILIQFSPFYLKAELYAMLSVIYNSKALFSVSLYGMLEGPKPWHVQGKAEFTFLKIKKKVNFDKVFGEEETIVLPDINVMPRLEEAANSSPNWQGIFPAASNLSVTLKQQEELAEPITLSHPNGSLRFEQKVVPMNTTINKFGKQIPMDYQHFSMKLADSAGDDFTNATTKEFFAPAEYVGLSDNEKLARKSFEKMDSGIKVVDTNRYDSSDYLTKKVEYEQIVYDSTEFGEKLPFLTAENVANFQSWVNNNSTSNSNLGSKKRAKSNFAPNKMKVASETFTIANLEDLSAFADVEGELTFGSEAEAHVALTDLFTNNPELVDQLDVVLEHELV